MTYVLLVLGFVLLIKGADLFVEGSAEIAKKLRVPSMIIGMTIVAMGTSLPECSVSVTASLAGNNALAVSNVIGSNIFNLMVVSGACALFAPLVVQNATLKKEFPFSVLVAVLLLGVGYMGMSVGRIDGAVLLILFIGFLLWMIHSAKEAREEGTKDEIKREHLPVWKCIIFLLAGAAGVIIGGNLVVDSASAVATTFGLSQNLIGLTIVAVGTSLPELVTSIAAARKNEVDMALGNVIGSNIFNILFVLGIATTISPIAFIMENIIDTIILIGMSAIVWLFAWHRNKIGRGEGVIMLSGYTVYMAYIIMR